MQSSASLGSVSLVRLSQTSRVILDIAIINSSATLPSIFPVTTGNEARRTRA